MAVLVVITKNNLESFIQMKKSANKTTNTRGFYALMSTQFFGAFNDNAFRIFASFLALHLLFSNTGRGDVNFMCIAGALFTIPFIIFSRTAGFLADRYSKRTVMIMTKAVEILILLLGILSLYKLNLNMMIVVVMLLGVQSAFFGPAKYGILPEILDDEYISKGNGLLQMWTFAAIIAGTTCGTFLATIVEPKITTGKILPTSDAYKALLQGNVEKYAFALGGVFVVCALIGFISSLFISKVPASGAKRKFGSNFFIDLKDTLSEIKQQRALFLCMIGVSWFWFMGAVFQLNIYFYGFEDMGIGSLQIGLLQIVLALGIGGGSILAGRWSGGKVEFGLVPLGAIGLGIFAILLGLSAKSFYLVLILFFFLGASAGLFNVPLNSYIQQKSPAQSKGRILAALNIMNFIGMLFSFGIFWLLKSRFNISASLLFILIGLASFIVIWIICRLIPDFLLRFLLWLLTHTLYKIKIVGGENIPRKGGALLVCNHVSYADGLLVQACIQRFVRFMIDRPFYEKFWLNPFCRIMKVIPISATDSTSRMRESLRQASEYLEQGEVVCLFAEGAITRTGNMLPFRKGLEIIMKNSNVPIIPINIDRVWGSLLSFEGGHILNHLPRSFPYPATISFGKAMSANSTAFEVQTAVRELGAEAFKHRPVSQQLLSTRFLQQAKKSYFRKCLADSNGKTLSYAKTAISAIAFARVIRRETPNQKMIGIYLPTSIPAAISNISITLLGKCSVNLNYTASEQALDHAIKQCNMKYIISSKLFLHKLKQKNRPQMVDIARLYTKINTLDRILATLAFILLPVPLLEKILRRKQKASQPATILFSSGSTGMPKGVMLSHTNINSNIEGIYQVYHLHKNTTIMGCLPFFHSFGYTATLWLPLTTGMSVVLHNNPLEFTRIGELIQQYQANLLMSTPTFLAGYMRKCTIQQLESLKYVVVGAEKLQPKLAKKFADKFGILPLEGYGCTELSPIVAVNAPDFIRGSVRQKSQKIGSIGKPLVGIVAKIVDPESFTPLPPNQQGLLLIKGPNVMLGYLNDAKKTKEVMHGDWYITGDIAKINTDGFITICDRLSRFSKIAGEMIPHIKIEETIQEIIGSPNEQRCIVTAIADPRKGEKLIVLHQGEILLDKVMAELDKSKLPNIWKPKRNAFIQIEKIPLLGSGKLDLQKVKKLAKTMTNKETA